MKVDRKVWDWRTIILHNGPENATYKHLLLTLSCYMDSAGQSCFPSITTLEKTTSLTRPTLVKYLKKAEQEGWITVRRKKAKNNEWSRNEYTASVPNRVVKEINHPVVKDVNRVVKEVNQGSKSDTGGVVKEVNSISPVNSSYNSPEKGAREKGSVVSAINTAETKADLLKIWEAYRKEKGKHMTMYERDVLLNSTWINEPIHLIKKTLLNTIENGWGKLVKPDDSGKEEKQFNPEIAKQFYA